MTARRSAGVVRRGKERHKAASGQPTHRLPDIAPPSSQHIWHGVSGATYTHTVTSLIFCPEMPQSTFLLLYRDGAGFANVLRVGTLDNEVPSLNLAQIRQLGASLGANEVHVRAERTSTAERARIAFDIENGMMSPDEATAAATAACAPHSAR